MKFLITYYNGYPSCEEEVVVEAEDQYEAGDIAEDGLSDYASSYDYIVEDECEEGEEVSDEMMQNYYGECGYTVEEYDD